MIAAAFSLWQREIVRFLKDRARVTSSLLQPIIFWVLFAGALRGSFRPGDVGYGEYFFAGTLVMICLFTAIFATITVIEDRREGFLQGVLVAPVPRASIALGKIAGGATLGWLLSVVFLLLAPIAGISFTVWSAMATLAVLLLVALAVTGIGFTLAWLMDSTAGYHGIMMVFLMPMLLLSGAFFPASGAHPVMQWIMFCNPLTYGVAAVRHALYSGGRVADAADLAVLRDIPSMPVSLAVTVVFAVCTFALGTWVVTRRSVRNSV